ncbi:MAG: VTC domain-containing protein [Myxococcota bacterium]
MSASLSADERLTANRSELKYRISVPQARAIAKVFDERLERHRFTGPGANRLPGARHYVTTVYFDTADGRLFADAQAQAGSLKVRAKEYYDQHVALTEVARDRSALFRASPVLWVELKETSGHRSGKRRIGIPKRDINSFFAHGTITEELLEIQRREYGEDASKVIDALREVCLRFDSPLRASALVNYRRSAWQGEGQTVRVTIDRNLAFFAPPHDLWESAPGLERNLLGPAVGEEQGCVLEVKSVGPLPAWLVDTLRAEDAAPARFSKFVAASSAVASAANGSHPS